MIRGSGARLPTAYNWREKVEAGGLMSYGENFPDMFRRTAELIDKVLRGVLRRIIAFVSLVACCRLRSHSNASEVEVRPTFCGGSVASSP
jgi:hypothetical protein